MNKLWTVLLLMAVIVLVVLLMRASKKPATVVSTKTNETSAQSNEASSGSTETSADYTEIALPYWNPLNGDKDKAANFFTFPMVVCAWANTVRDRDDEGREKAQKTLQDTADKMMTPLFPAPAGVDSGDIELVLTKYLMSAQAAATIDKESPYFKPLNEQSLGLGLECITIQRMLDLGSLSPGEVDKKKLLASFDSVIVLSKEMGFSELQIRLLKSIRFEVKEATSTLDYKQQSRLFFRLYLGIAKIY